jgi:DNA topoisomerase-1
LRVGNEKGEDEADTVGCCSLRVEHIQFENDNKITFDFLGKDSMRYHNTVEVDPLVYKNLKRFIAGKNKNEDLFDRINASRLNDYLKDMMSNLSAKVFRTYNASITL